MDFDYNLIYQGSEKEKFIKLSKIFIPYAEDCFDYYIQDNDSKAKMFNKDFYKWYTILKDLTTLMSYLSDGDNITISFRTELDDEGQFIIKKANNQVIVEDNEYSRLIKEKNFDVLNPFYGFTDMVCNLSRSDFEAYERLHFFAVDKTSLEGFTRYLADLVDDDETVLPAVQKFIYDSLKPECINAFMNEYDFGNEEVINSFREHFKSLESTREFLRSEKEKGLIYKKPDTILENLIHRYPTEASDSLGDAYRLQNFIDSKSGDFYGGDRLHNITRPVEFNLIKTVLNLFGYVIDRHLLVYDKDGKFLSEFYNFTGKIMQDNEVVFQYGRIDFYESVKAYEFTIGKQWTERNELISISLELPKSKGWRKLDGNADYPYQKLRISKCYKPKGEDSKSELILDLETNYNNNYNIVICDHKGLGSPINYWDEKPILAIYGNEFVSGITNYKDHIRFIKDYARDDGVSAVVERASVQEFIRYVSSVFEQLIPGITEQIFRKCAAYEYYLPSKEKEETNSQEDSIDIFPYYEPLKSVFPLEINSKENKTFK